MNVEIVKIFDNRLSVRLDSVEVAVLPKKHEITINNLEEAFKAVLKAVLKAAYEEWD